jgi:riboflavin synthase
MFTGLVETIGTVRETNAQASGCRQIVVESTLSNLKHGESISIDGACMTVDKFGASGEQTFFTFDVMPESLSLTTLGELAAGDRVNLERALAIGDLLGGHLVSGHVDGMATVDELVTEGDDYRICCSIPKELRRFLALKGSVTLSGVSLTVSGIHPRGFEVALIPVTLVETTLARLTAGSHANVEVDLVARYLERLIPPQS